MTGMIEWGGGGKRGEQNPKESLGQKLTPQKTHARFLSVENFQKTLLNDKTQQVWLYVILRTMDT